MESARSASARLLYVEDDRATREGYVAYLESCGYEVKATGSGRDVLALAHQNLPAVIVLDLGLKDIDGWEVARQLKADPATADVPIIAFTGASLPHERISAMRAGCDRVLNKPCAPSALVDEIGRCLAHAPRREA
jgi:two-component system cell cycle response regulator DivK